MGVRILLLIFLLALCFCADSFTNCYANCNTCSLSDFTECSPGAFPCVYGYALTGTKCNAVPSFDNYATEFASTNLQQNPLGWLSGVSSVTNTLTCSTIKQGQTIGLIGPFNSQQVSKIYTVAPRSTMFVQLYFLRMNWIGTDSVTINVLSNGVTIYTEVVGVSSYVNPAQNTNYLTNCSNLATQVWGAQITLSSSGSSNSTSISIVFTPSVSASASWAFSDVKVSTGCGSFTVSQNGTCNSCLSGYYYSSTSLDCQKCHPLCNSCFGPTNTNCLACPLQSTLNGNTCVYSSNFYVMNDVTVDQGTAANTSSCSNINMLGGPTYGQIGNVLPRKYILPRHILLKLSFWLVRIGDWSGVTGFTASIDGTPYITISNFQEPGLSPLCLKQVGPVLVSTSESVSNFQNHNNTQATLTFAITGTGSNTTLYGVNDISLVAFNCPPQCNDCVLTANFTPNCLSCNQFLSQSSGCLLCPNGFFLDTTDQYSTVCRKCYSTCLDCNGAGSLNCTSCFPGYMLVGTYCTPNTTLAYTLYSQQLTSNVFNQNDYLSSTGQSFMCGPYRVFGSQGPSPTSISRTWKDLPAHKGLILNMQVFKLGPWTNGSNIVIKLDNNQVITIPINESSGSSLCSGGKSDFIYTISVPLDQHSDSNLAMNIQGNGGIAIGNVILSLQNCPDCANTQFGYNIQYIPVYTSDNSRVGMNTFIKFNRPVSNVSQLAQNFQLYMNAIPLNVTDWDDVNDLRLYTPFPKNYSFINGTLTILNKDPSQVLSQTSDNIPPQQLTTIRSSTQVARYDTLYNQDNRIPISQLYTLFKGYTSAILYLAISVIGIGFGLVFQEFVVALQIIFMHIYVMTNWLPASLKVPMSGMHRIEHLNYFMNRDINRIEGAILPKGLHQISPHTFQQYNTDINFTRAIYPIFILNLIYVAYWIIIYSLYKCLPSFRRSPNVIARWFREIVERPLNFFDYLFRLQFITVAWSCFVQYRHFNSSNVISFRDFNYFWTILFFVCLCLYPFIMVCYLLRTRGIILKESFNYLYEDIFFMRIKRNHDQMSSFVYILVRFLRYFIICCFIAFFASDSLVGPILCLIMTAVETLFIIFRSVYVDPFYFLFKLVQNLFLFLFDIIYIIIFATANRWQLQSYLNLGFVADAFIIVILVNASLRSLYLIYLKIRVFCARNYRLDRAYNVASLGFDYRPPVQMVTENLLIGAPGRFGAPSNIFINSNVGGYGASGMGQGFGMGSGGVEMAQIGGFRQSGVANMGIRGVQRQVITTDQFIPGGYAANYTTSYTGESASNDYRLQPETLNIASMIADGAQQMNNTRNPYPVANTSTITTSRVVNNYSQPFEEERFRQTYYAGPMPPSL